MTSVFDAMAAHFVRSRELPDHLIRMASAFGIRPETDFGHAWWIARVEEFPALQCLVRGGGYVDLYDGFEQAMVLMSHETVDAVAYWLMKCEVRSAWHAARIYVLLDKVMQLSLASTHGALAIRVVLRFARDTTYTNSGRREPNAMAGNATVVASVSHMLRGLSSMHPRDMVAQLFKKCRAQGLVSLDRIHGHDPEDRVSDEDLAYFLLH